MEIALGKNKKTRRVYGFDEVALVPSIVTVNPEDADVSIEHCPIISNKGLSVIPLIAAILLISSNSSAAISKFCATLTDEVQPLITNILNKINTIDIIFFIFPPFSQDVQGFY